MTAPCSKGGFVNTHGPREMVPGAVSAQHVVAKITGRATGWGRQIALPAFAQLASTEGTGKLPLPGSVPASVK